MRGSHYDQIHTLIDELTLDNMRDTDADALRAILRRLCNHVYGTNRAVKAVIEIDAKNENVLGFRNQL